MSRGWWRDVGLPGRTRRRSRSRRGENGEGGRVGVLHASGTRLRRSAQGTPWVTASPAAFLGLRALRPQGTPWVTGSPPAFLGLRALRPQGTPCVTPSPPAFLGLRALRPQETPWVTASPPAFLGLRGALALLRVLRALRGDPLGALEAHAARPDRRAPHRSVDPLPQRHPPDLDLSSPPAAAAPPRSRPQQPPCRSGTPPNQTSAAPLPQRHPPEPDLTSPPADAAPPRTRPHQPPCRCGTPPTHARNPSSPFSPRRLLDRRAVRAASRGRATRPSTRRASPRSPPPR